MTADLVVRDETEMAVRVKDPTVPVTPWTPPLDQERLRELLARAREWEPVDWELVFDGLDAVLCGGQEMSHHAAGAANRHRAGATVPDYGEAGELAQRFRGALMQLVNRGLRDSADQYPDIARLIERARSLRSETLPDDSWQALAFLRRLGQVTLELVERLDEVGIVKGLVEC
ncbi:DUF6415 family natural product biosynthesis protein [Streptomyces sp. JNUCC 64]